MRKKQGFYEDVIILNFYVYRYIAIGSSRQKIRAERGLCSRITELRSIKGLTIIKSDNFNFLIINLAVYAALTMFVINEASQQKLLVEYPLAEGPIDFHGLFKRGSFSITSPTINASCYYTFNTLTCNFAYRILNFDPSEAIFSNL